MEAFAKTLKAVGELVQRAGPYLLIEILLPGGTLFALLLFVMRNRGSSGRPLPAAQRVVMQAIAGVRRSLMLVQPYDIAAVANVEAANDDGLGPIAMVPGR